MVRREVVASGGLVAAAVVVLACWGAAGAQAGALETAKVDSYLNRDGSGFMIVNSELNPDSERWSWERCDSALAVCAPFAHGREVETGEASAPSVFRATSNRGPIALSPLWRGNVSSTAPPSVTGEIRAGELVRPVHGKWQGGWEGGDHITQLAACETRDGRGCTTLTDIHYPRSCRRGAAVIDPLFEGEYLRVADELLGPDTAFPDYAVGSPYGSEIWDAAPTVSVAIVGRIRSATGHRPPRCGPPKLHPAHASIGKRGRVRAYCPLECRVVLKARRESRRVRIRRRLYSLARATFRFPREARRRLRGGQVHVSVRIDGRRVAHRNVTRLR